MISPSIFKSEYSRILQLRKNLETQFSYLQGQKSLNNGLNLPLIGSPLIRAINENISIYYRLEIQVIDFESIDIKSSSYLTSDENIKNRYEQYVENYSQILKDYRQYLKLFSAVKNRKLLAA